MRGMIEQSSEIVMLGELDFKTAKKINNDFVDILRVLTELEMRTEVGKEVRERFMEVVTYELEKLENSRVVGE